MKPSRLTWEQLREKTCGSKVKHLSRSAARSARKLSQKRYRVKMSAYLCVFCGFYHIGHKNKKEAHDVNCTEGSLAS